MGGSDDTRLLVEIAHMYYDDQLRRGQKESLKLRSGTIWYILIGIWKES